jgi:hypothetical protein
MYLKKKPNYRNFDIIFGLISGVKYNKQKQIEKGEQRYNNNNLYITEVRLLEGIVNLR